jgi:hypothetical protein
VSDASDLEVIEARIWSLLEPYRGELEALLARLYKRYRADQAATA